MLAWPPRPLLRRFLRVSWLIRGSSPCRLARAQNPTTADRFSGCSGYWSGYQCQLHIPSASIPTSGALCNTWGVLGVIWGSGLVCGEVWGSAWFGEWASFRKEGGMQPITATRFKIRPASDSPFQLFAVADVLPGAGILALRCRSGAFWPMQNATSFAAMQM